MDCSSFSSSSVRVKGRADEALARPAILEVRRFGRGNVVYLPVTFSLMQMETRRDFGRGGRGGRHFALFVNTCLPSLGTR
jgi:hypothetical protein